MSDVRSVGLGQKLMWLLLRAAPWRFLKNPLGKKPRQAASGYRLEQKERGSRWPTP